MAGSAQTHKSMSFIWIVWSTLYVYLWSLVEVLLEQIYAVLTSHVTNDTVSIQIVYEDAMADKKRPPIDWKERPSSQ